MRGDRPQIVPVFVRQALFTPHARGSTSPSYNSFRTRAVYPACAGIDLVRTEEQVVHESLPRMRGDRPTYTHFRF